MPVVDEVKNVRSTLPYHRRAIVSRCAYIPQEKRNILQKAGSVTWGQLLGGLVTAGSIYDGIHRFIFKRGEDFSWWRTATDVLGILLGGSSIIVSKPPKNVFDANLFRTSIITIFDKIKQLGELKLFSADDLNGITGSVNNIIDTINRQVSRLVKEALKSKMQEHLDSSSEEFDPERSTDEPKLISLDPGDVANFLRNVQDNVFATTAYNPVRGPLDNVFECLSNAFKSIGIYVDYSFDKDRSLVKVYVCSNVLYEDSTKPGKYFEPAFIMYTSPERLHYAFDELKKRLNRIKPEIQNELPSNSNDSTKLAELNKRVLLALRDSYKILNSGDIKPAFAEIDKGIHERPRNLKRKLVNESLETLIPAIPLFKLLSWLQSSEPIEYDEAKRMDEIQQREISSSSGHESGTGSGPISVPYPKIRSNNEDPISPDLPTGLRKLTEIKQALGFKTFDHIDDRVKSLKLALVKAYIFRETVSLGENFEHAVKIRDEINVQLKDELSKNDYAIYEGIKVGTKEFPGNLLEFDYFLGALEINNNIISKGVELSIRKLILLIPVEKFRLAVNNDLESKISAISKK